MSSKLQGIDLEFNVPRAVIKFWQSELDLLTDKMEKSLDAIDAEKSPAKKESMYLDAQALVGKAKVVRANIDRCSKDPSVTANCRDSRAPGEPWPDEPIEVLAGRKF